MRCHEENTPTTTTKEVTTKITTRIKMAITVKRFWNKNNKSSYQKKDDKKESKDKDVYLTLTKDVKISTVLQDSMRIYLPVLVE